jgi:hypothetical protein
MSSDRPKGGLLSRLLGRREEKDTAGLPAAAREDLPADRAQAEAVDAFLAKVRETPRQEPVPASARRGRRGRLIFSMDATMSRQPTWDRAQHLQAEMFHAAAGLGGLDVQLVFYRGHGECRASRWVDDPRRLASLMSRVECRGGYTQIGRVFRHVLKQTATAPVDAVVHVGDAFEEDVDAVAHLAGEIALQGIPIFMFQEGHDPVATRAFAEFARLSGGAHCRFDEGAAATLRGLLAGVAVFAAGGMEALRTRALEAGEAGEGARLLLSHMRK